MIAIRMEEPKDEGAVFEVNLKAFGQRDEAELVALLREKGAVSLSLVVVLEGRIVGHILFSPVRIESGVSEFPALGLAPMAVLPEFQGKGVGSELVLRGIEECRSLGHEIVVVLGHPKYYPRFGFVPAKPLGIRCEFEAPDDAWMLLELREGVLAGRTGVARFQPEFGSM